MEEIKGLMFTIICFYFFFKFIFTTIMYYSTKFYHHHVTVYFVSNKNPLSQFKQFKNSLYTHLFSFFFCFQFQLQANIVLGHHGSEPHQINVLHAPGVRTKRIHVVKIYIDTFVLNAKKIHNLNAIYVFENFIIVQH